MEGTVRKSLNPVIDVVLDYFEAYMNINKKNKKLFFGIVTDNSYSNVSDKTALFFGEGYVKNSTIHSNTY